jgi:hypothetical protein
MDSLNPKDIAGFTMTNAPDGMVNVQFVGHDGNPIGKVYTIRKPEDGFLKKAYDETMLDRRKNILNIIEEDDKPDNSNGQ